MQRTVQASLRSTTPYVQSRYLRPAPALQDDHREWEQQHWRNRMYCNGDGNVVIPREHLHAALVEAARRMRLKVPGRHATYDAYVAGGIGVPADIALTTHRNTVRGEWWQGRCYPVIDEWEATVTLTIADDSLLTEDVVSDTLAYAGHHIGLGRGWRGWVSKFKKGNWGQFAVLDFAWDDIVTRLGKLV